MAVQVAAAKTTDGPDGLRAVEGEPTVVKATNNASIRLSDAGTWPSRGPIRAVATGAAPDNAALGRVLVYKEAA